jgi:hypothetical protein
VGGLDEVMHRLNILVTSIGRSMVLAGGWVVEVIQQPSKSSDPLQVWPTVWGIDTSLIHRISPIWKDSCTEIVLILVHVCKY